MEANIPDTIASIATSAFVRSCAFSPCSEHAHTTATVATLHHLPCSSLATVVLILALGVYDEMFAALVFGIQLALAVFFSVWPGASADVASMYIFPFTLLLMLMVAIAGGSELHFFVFIVRLVWGLASMHAAIVTQGVAPGDAIWAGCAGIVAAWAWMGVVVLTRPVLWATARGAYRRIHAAHAAAPTRARAMALYLATRLTFSTTFILSPQEVLEEVEFSRRAFSARSRASQRSAGKGAV